MPRAADFNSMLLAGRPGQPIGETVAIVVVATLIGLILGVGVRRARQTLSDSRHFAGDEPEPRPMPLDDHQPTVITHVVGGGLRAIELRLERFGWLFWRLAALATALTFAWILLPNLDGNPVGFFCDEAEIGLETQRLVSAGIRNFDLPLFYTHFGYHHLGALPLYAGAPIAAIFGLDVQSVRLQAVVWSVLGVLPLIALVRRLGWRYGEVGVIAFACTPVFIHLARFNFGLAPSFFCVAAGLGCYARARESDSIRWGAAAGVAIAVSAYGNGAYYIAAPLIALAIALGEIAGSGRRWRAYRTVLAMGIAAAIVAIPVVVKAATDPFFMRRFNERTGSGDGFSFSDVLQRVTENYPKYFTLDYLVRLGESGIAGPGNYRHSVPGAGELTWLVVGLVLAGIVMSVTAKDKATRFGGVTGLAMLIFYPIPDSIVSNPENPPYTITTFSMFIFAPLLAACGVTAIARLSGRLSRSPILVPGSLSAALLAVALIGAARFNIGPYANYPKVSAGYYGWQYGAEDAIDVLRRSQAGYDRLYLDGQFNEAFVHLDFFMHDEPNLRAKTAIGDFSRVSSSTRSLYALRIENVNTWLERPEPIRGIIKIVYVLKNPAGEVAMVVVEVDPKLGDRRTSIPW